MAWMKRCGSSMVVNSKQVVLKGSYCSTFQVYTQGKAENILRGRTKRSGRGVRVQTAGEARWCTIIECHPNTNKQTQELCESGGGRPGLPSLISLRFLWT